MQSATDAKCLFRTSPVPGGRGQKRNKNLIPFERSFLSGTLNTIWKNGKGSVSLGMSRGLNGATIGDCRGETLAGWGWYPRL